MRVRRNVSIVIMLVTIVPVLCIAGWMRTYGWNEHETGRVVEETEDGYIVFGNGKLSIWILKMDTSGDTTFTRTYSTDLGGWVNDASPTGDGGYMVAGGTYTSQAGLTDAWVLRLDSDLDTLWSRTYGGADFDNVIGVAPAANGFVITGYRDGVEDPQYGYLDDSKLWLLKIDPDGEVLWEKTYGDADSYNAGYSISPTDDGGYILSCRAFYSPATFTRASLMRTDETGDSLWTFRSDELSFFDAIETSDNGYAACGGKGFYAALARLSSEGILQWYQSWGEDAPYSDFALCVKETSGGGYILVGNAKERFDSQGHPTRANLWLIKTDENGDTIWTRQYGNDLKYDNGWCVRPTSDGGYVMTGSTETYGDVEGDLWLIKTDEYGMVAVQEPVADVEQDWELVSAIGSEIVLRYEDKPDGFHARVFDASGRLVDEVHSTQTAGSVIWGEAAPDGVYFIQEVSAESTQKIILLE